jgi:hypothetical protein
MRSAVRSVGFFGEIQAAPPQLSAQEGSGGMRVTFYYADFATLLAIKILTISDRLRLPTYWPAWFLGGVAQKG